MDPHRCCDPNVALAAKCLQALDCANKDRYTDHDTVIGYEPGSRFQFSGVVYNMYVKGISHHLAPTWLSFVPTPRHLRQALYTDLAVSPRLS